MTVTLTNMNENSAQNFNMVSLGHWTRFYFSYETIVAFHTKKRGLVISENVWSRTTGKHLNWINDDKSVRVPHDEFLKLLDEVIERNE